MPLTDAKLRTLKPSPKPQKLSDFEGLFLLVTPSGSRLWRMAYRFSGKQKVLALGTYPDVSLRDARKAKDEARELLEAGAPRAARMLDRREFQETSRLLLAFDASALPTQRASEMVEMARKNLLDIIRVLEGLRDRKPDRFDQLERSAKSMQIAAMELLPMITEARKPQPAVPPLFFSFLRRSRKK